MSDNLPKHIALVPNGNRTWARLHGLPESEGHQKGAEVLREITRYMRDVGIHTASVWASSTENFRRRSKAEMQNLIRLLEFVMDNWAEEAAEQGARIVHIGRKDLLPKKAAQKITHWEEKTKANTKHVLNIAFAYGGHDELMRAFKKAYLDLQANKIKFEDLEKEDGMYNEKYPYTKFRNYLDTAGQPHPFPDLVIRSAGENRLSGWMPWQSVYSEFIAVDKLNPDFTPETIEDCLKEYQRRNRKFGGN